MNKPWKVMVAFAGVFVAGMIAGGPLLSRWQAYRYDRRPPWLERTMAHYEHHLRITPAQKEKIMPILLQVQKEWRQQREDNVRVMTSIIDRMHEAVGAELTPEQRQKIEGMRQEMRERAERYRGRTHEREQAQDRRTRE